jgi:hypothetical protein
VDDLTIVLWDDYGGNPREVFHSIFDEEEKKKWDSFFANFPLNSLHQKYENPAVDDGLQIFFVFHLPGKPQKEIILRNVNQPNLFSLCDEINKYVPEKFKVRQQRSAVVIGH